MTKYTIPILLAVTVLVAGIFALMPLEKASTVHTTIQAGLQAEKTDVNFSQDFTGTALVAGVPVTIIADDADTVYLMHLRIDFITQGAGNKVIFQTSADGGATFRTVLDSGDDTAVTDDVTFVGDALRIDCGAGDTCVLGTTNTIAGSAIGLKTG